jgi:hypothetical protein
MADAADEIVGTIFPVTETPPPEAPSAAPTPEPQGVQPPPVQTVAAPPVPEQGHAPEAPPQGGQIPIQALLDEREKRQGLQRERDELLAWRRSQEAQRQQPAAPDPYDDPVAWSAHQAQLIEQNRLAVTEQISERFAVQAHGPETVEAAKQWAMQRRTSDPLIGQQFVRQADPFGWLVTEYKRDRLLNEIGSDPDAYVRRRFAELGDGSGISPVAAPVAIIPPTPSTPAPPRSQAGLPSAGGGHQTVPVHSMAAVEGLFPKG